MKTRIMALVFSAKAFCASLSGADLTLWYQQPAADKKPMNEALPIGNGRIGGLIFGEPARERITANEDSLWTGDDNPGGDDKKMGSYQVLGNVFVNLRGHPDASDYRRDLDLEHALSHVSFTSNGTRFQREFFCSHPAQALVAHFSANKAASYTGSVELVDSHDAKIGVAGNRITASGTLGNGRRFEWQVVVLNLGGSVAAASDSASARIEFKDCDGLTLLIAAGTDYAMNYPDNYRGEDPHSRVAAQIDAAATTPFGELKAAHLKDYESFFNRVSADFGKSSDAQTGLPTDKRKLDAFQKVDPGLEALLFQYGRYLLISCSRPGGLPANLQGLWCDTNSPAWHSDYHANINVEMNYWPAEVANLAECHTPFFDLIESQLPAWRKATAAAEEFKTADGQYSKRGFALRTSHNITGGMGWKWDKTANAWYCHHLWEHYAFGRDKNYLRTVAYPIMKETCQFWEDHLKALPDGTLVVPNAWSPEHGPVEDGVSYSQEIVWDLFDNFVRASSALGTDADARGRIAAMRDRLAAPGIGSWGQLLEWMHEEHNSKYPELDTPGDHHRHTSHLFAVYPGAQISAGKTPDLAKAAKVTLDARGIAPGSDVREWSFAWRTALYARLRDSESAHKMLQQLFSARNTCPNLFGLHPPMQIDGDFGVTAGIAEMLMQSQEGGIELLPALPQAWPAGHITGLRARGGYEVGVEWKDGKLLSATVKNVSGDGKCQVRNGRRVVMLDVSPGDTRRLDEELR